MLGIPRLEFAIEAPLVREVLARAPRDQVTQATLANGLVPKLSISFSDGSAWSMDVPRVVKKQGDTNRIVELLGG